MTESNDHTSCSIEVPHHHIGNDVVYMGETIEIQGKIIPHGYGEFKFIDENKTIYIGYISNGKYEGEGTLYHKHGKMIGTFSNNTHCGLNEQMTSIAGMTSLFRASSLGLLPASISALNLPQLLLDIP